MYLDYFKLKELPFALTPNLSFFCHLKGHQEALNTILFSLQSGEGFIKIVGEVGSGKTLLCRKLLNNLENDYITAYIPNPDLTPIELRRAFAREMGIDPSLLHDQHELLTHINQQLLHLNAEGKRIVLLIDEAQALPLETLEALRLLTNLETEKTKLLQVVLFGQPELDEHLKLPQFRQLKQRISFSYYLPILTRDELDTYLFHRLSAAGIMHGTLFTEKARDFIYKASRGIPRLVNILCHKALLIAYGKGESKVTHKMVRFAVKDTDAVMPSTRRYVWLYTLLGITFFVVGIFYFSG